MNNYYKDCAYPKPMMKKKKRETVTEQTYYKVYNACKGECVMCGKRQNLQLHHIKYRSERKDLINTPSNCVMLCIMCHSEAHKNKRKWQPILLEIAQKIYKGD